MHAVCSSQHRLRLFQLPSTVHGILKIRLKEVQNHHQVYRGSVVIPVNAWI
jgi:hypothetical protein